MAHGPPEGGSRTHRSDFLTVRTVSPARQPALHRSDRSSNRIFEPQPIAFLPRWGLFRPSLALPGCGSLKDKRRIVKSLKDRLRGRFNVSVAETDHQDVWTRAQLSIAFVTTDGRLAESLLSKVDRLIEGETRAVILSSKRDLH